MKLFEPIRIGSLQVKNRIVMPPMGMGYANEDGSVSEQVVRYYEQRAESGVGMIVVENCIIDPDVLGVGPELYLYDDRFIPGLARLAESIKAHGAVAGIQLNHMGRQTTLGKPVAPSPIGISERGPVPRVLVAEEIRHIVQEFATAARRAQQAGFDFVEIHGAHGYLVCEFLSPFSNHRDDEYGGDPQRRMRFALDIVAAMRQPLGPRYPIQFRISGSEYIPGGLTIEDTLQISRSLVAAGVACISVSAGNWQTLHYIMAPMFLPPGYLADDAARIKAGLSVPVIAVGRIHTPELAEQILQQGKADLVAVGRGLIADPNWALKLRQNRADDIRPCISCNACVDLVSRALQAKCTVNAGLGKELEVRVTPTSHPRRVLVAGGGPAGLEAARVAAERGHHVTLVEKDSRLGGKLHLSAAAPSKRGVAAFTEYLIRQIKKLRVEVQLGRDLDRQGLFGLQPDLVLLATGSVPVVPPIAGASQPQVLLAEDVMLGRAKAGRRVVIVGGGATGCELAEFLLPQGHHITILEMISHIGAGIEAITRRWMFYELKRAGVRLQTRSKVVRIESDRVIYTDHNQKEQAAECDTAVIALGYRPNDDLAFCADDEFSLPVYRIGDCEKPGTILDAVTAGATIASRI